MSASALLEPDSMYLWALLACAPAMLAIGLLATLTLCVGLLVGLVRTLDYGYHRIVDTVEQRLADPDQPA